MSFNRILELAQKFAEMEEPYNQKHKLELFYDDFYKKFRTVLNEMEGDIFTIKEKGIDKNILREFAILWKSLIDIFKRIDENQPYESATRLIYFVESKNNKHDISKLNQSIQHFLKKNELNLSSPLMQNSRVDSIRELFDVVEHLVSYMKSNPVNMGLTNKPDASSEAWREDKTKF